MMNNQKADAIPECIGIIIDGNRRWAKAQGLQAHLGHKRGGEIIRNTIMWAKEAGVKHIIFYTFSTENWNRSEEEKTYLFELLKNILDKEIRSLAKERVRVWCIGQRERFNKDLQEKMNEIEEVTRHNTECTVTFALSYGGRAEITHTINTFLKNGAREVTEDEVSKALWTKDIPDPDIIIRTGGEKRLSNFLPWQGVYSELFFTDTFWPAFSKEEFIGILGEYATRERRRGK